MKDQEIVDSGKYVFGLFFVMGSICLLGGLLTKLEAFAAGGYLLIIFGSILNLFFVLGLLIYGMINKAKSKACLKAVGILLINIPIAVLYAVIGISLYT
ncbi:MAG: hypothetical protein MUW56_13540 [Chryseobacterium sp.]|uniref:hypothetical protein n=1 Tax=Chryseobacterium sp. TaxID=1871047 RepID=UPI0025BB2B95|nr:hypothetical protein [Chryseobacterium sp.]MCJ7934617.1 hypothetical protein [Chryseobacterium sp.]